MVLGINNFFDARNKNAKVADFQDLDHLDGVSVSAVSANLYEQKRDDLVLFYFRNGANHSSLFTKSSVVSENIKWNRKIKSQKIHALLINTRNANALTGSDGYEALKTFDPTVSGYGWNTAVGWTAGDSVSTGYSNTETNSIGNSIFLVFILIG